MHINPITTSLIRNDVPNANIPGFKGTVDFDGLKSIFEKNNYDMINHPMLSSIRKRIEHLMKYFSEETKLVFKYNGKEPAYYPNGTIMEEPYHLEIYNVTLENANSEYKHALPNFKIFNNPSPVNYPKTMMEIYEKWSTLLSGFSLNNVFDCFKLPTPARFDAFNALPQVFPDNDIKHFQDLLNNISMTNSCSIEDKFYEMRKRGGSCFKI